MVGQSTPTTMDAQQFDTIQAENQDENQQVQELMGLPTGQYRFDGKQLRTKTGLRKIVDLQSSVAVHLHNRIFQRDHRDRRALQPDPLYNVYLPPPAAFPDKPISSVCTRMVRAATNRTKSPIYCVRWTPEGRWLVTGAKNGDFTLWDGKTFCFTKVQASHNSAVRAMEWSRDGLWMISSDAEGFVKYWQSNMNNVMMKKIHVDEVRGLSFAPGGDRFVSCSFDNTIRRWDFATCREEFILRGHGAEVICVDWNPEWKIIASGSKDSRMPVKLWDAGSGECLDTIYSHKHPVMDVKWSRDGKFLLTASRDHVLMLFDLRNRNLPLRIFRGHRKEVTTIAWHPLHGDLFASGGIDGSVNYWSTDCDERLAGVEKAHDGHIWSLDWHPTGHVLVSGSSDFSTKFWTRNKLGDKMRDRFNMNTFSSGEDYDDCTDGFVPASDDLQSSKDFHASLIPGLDLPSVDIYSRDDAQYQMTRRLKRCRDEYASERSFVAKHPRIVKVKSEY